MSNFWCRSQHGTHRNSQTSTSEEEAKSMGGLVYSSLYVSHPFFLDSRVNFLSTITRYNPPFRHAICTRSTGTSMTRCTMGRNTPGENRERSTTREPLVPVESAGIIGINSPRALAFCARAVTTQHSKVVIFLVLRISGDVGIRIPLFLFSINSAIV